MGIPKYEQIKLDLLNEIKARKFLPGDKFYSESDLKERYDVSSITVVKALNELTAAGYLYRLQGKGTFVSKLKVAANVRLSDLEKHSASTETVKVTSITKENDPKVLKELMLPSEHFYYKIARVRYSEDKPFLIHYSHLPIKLIKEPIQDFEAYKSVYKYIHNVFGIDLYSLKSLETNEIVFPEDPNILNHLNLTFREPVIQQIKHSYLNDGSVAEYVISYKHWKYFKIKIETDAL